MNTLKRFPYSILLLFLFITCQAFAQSIERDRPANWDALVLGARFQDRFQPMHGSIHGEKIWGAEGVRQRFVDNGIEDNAHSYWGGNILRGSDGRYHLFVCGWLENSPKGHHTWPQSTVFHTVSDNYYGPFSVRDTIGPGHNPEAFRTSDGHYVIYVIDHYYVSDDLNGPWTRKEFEFDTRDRRIIEGLSNLTFTMREDGSILMVDRGGGVWISRTGLSEYHQISDGTIYPPVEGAFEDPVVWRDSVQYNAIVNDWYGRRAYYLRSKDGLHWITDPGEAYSPGIAVHPDGTREEWFKYERCKIFQDEHGRAVQTNFAVIDTLKDEDKGGDIHSSKNICIPLNPGLMLKILNRNAITKDTKRIKLLIKAEPGFNPQTDLDIKTLRFGANSEVNFGRGCKPLRTKKSGDDLVVIFDGSGSGITQEEFAPKLLGRDKNGEMVFGYVRLPKVEYIVPLLSARRPTVDGSEMSIVVENFGQVKSKVGHLKVILPNHGNKVLCSAELPAIEPYGKVVIKVKLGQPLSKDEIDDLWAEPDEI